MKILIIRHAHAGKRSQFAKTGLPDDSRPLSKKGMTKMRQAARGLKLIAKDVDLIASSPLTRAEQTADIVAPHYKKAKRLKIQLLSPDEKPAKAVSWLKKRREETLTLVGHEPHLGRLIARLCGAKRAATKLKKGQACLIEDGKLSWSLQPSQLSFLARRKVS